MVLVSLVAGACCDATSVAPKSAEGAESFILVMVQRWGIQDEKSYMAYT